MKVIDLTHTISEDMPVFPGSETPKLTTKSTGSLTLANSQNSQMSFRYGFFYVKFLFLSVVCVVYL